LTQLSLEFRITKVKCGIDNTGFITEEGFLFVMGSNNHGKLGIGLTFEQCQKVTKPVLVNEISNNTIVDMSFGKSHSLAVCQRGKVFAWGKVSEGFPTFNDLDRKAPVLKPLEVYRVPAT
jgi:E3 ubiquitin-protein ligase HERC3